MGKVHALITEQIKEAETETSGVSLRDGLIAKARAVVDRMMTHWANLDDTELKVIVDDLEEWEKMADTAIEQMENKPAEVVETVNTPPSVTDAPTPEPDKDAAGQGAATDDPPLVPSQIDSISSAEDGPISRNEFQSLLARVMQIELYIKRKQPDFE